MIKKSNSLQIMEAAENFRHLRPAEKAVLSNEYDNTQPQDDEAVLYSDYVLPEYDSEVDPDSITLGRPRQQDNYGTTTPMKLTMHSEDQETSYDLLKCQANNPVSDIWIVKDTAWTTQPRGLNTVVARKLMSIGFNVLIKGPEIGSSITMSQSAFNTHKTLDSLEQRGDLDAGSIAVEGYSRGSMIGFGTNAYASWFNRQVVYSNLTDPCVALPIQFDKETAKKAAGLPVDLAKLGIDVFRGVFSSGPGMHLLETFDASPKGFVQFIRTGKPLMNGEAGKMAARTPQDMLATIAFFQGCGVNDRPTYEKILADRPGVRFVTPEGGHGKGIDSKIIGNIALRFNRLAQQLQDGRLPQEYDHRYITHGVRLAT